MKIRVCKTMICFSLVRSTYFNDFLGNRSQIWNWECFIHLDIDIPSS